MIVPGPKVTYTLESPPTGRTSGGGASGSWTTVTTFRGSLGPMTVRKSEAFGTIAEFSTHLAIVGSEEVDAFATSMQAPNRLTITNSENDLAAETLQIDGVLPYRYPGNNIATYELALRVVQ